MPEILEKIIDDAYGLYMPQVRSEITALAEYVQEYDCNVLKRGGMATVEIGTKYGGTFWIWCSMFNAEDDLNISIDFSDGGRHGGISDAEMDNRDKLFNETFTNCKFIRGDSHATSTHFQLFKLLENWKHPHQIGKIDGTVDFLFIDGDHSYEGVKQDFEMYSPLVKSKSLIVFHDIIISEQHHSRNVYVGEFWNEIKNDSRFNSFEIIGDANQTWAGIGVLVVK